MKILHVIPSLGQGGAEKMLALLVNHPAPGQEHHIATFIDGAPFYDIGPHVKLHRLAGGRLGLAGAPLALARLAARLRPALVHGWMYHANALCAAARLGGAKVVWGLHNSGLASQLKGSTMAVSGLCAAMSGLIPWRIVYCAEHVRQNHQRQGYAVAKGLVLPNAVDGREFFIDPAARARLRASLGLTDDQPVIGLAARLAADKGHAVFLEAAAVLARRQPKLAVLVCGRGCQDDNPQWRELATPFGLGGRLCALGQWAAMNDFYNCLDLLAITSPIAEGAPMTLLEALAAGAAVAASDVPGLRGAVPPEGRLCPPGDAAALARAMAEMLARAAPGRSAISRDWVLARHGVEAVAAAHAALYAQAAAQGR
ncbi:glycosyl transferase group 1 [Desulfarculus baarsii DSM 2075]|uniref:Glycosyl transferase group 1 n=1 Tax=Desulfarculus baarsii (strain ATCC 33931 / DSM 2075 / LMG 7858 / VKM B-1802 / 2st14) TaxID=644282 RepID=E1QM82_DESB2|nr:glycosyltransferase [Desulfarculus baarsii]ADK86125.1 glycosyl transferase group 1 [Desulfarculus baarsii DSM 2075]